MREASQRIEKSLYKSVDGILKEYTFNIPLTNNFDIFLCHSFKDANIILGLTQTLEDMGYSIYIDHQIDPQMNRQHVTSETAETLRNRMRHSKALFYVTSDNSYQSLWMPWELGYFDGFKGTVAILPLTNEFRSNSNEYIGQEYLGIYPYITHDKAESDLSRDRLWIHWSPNEYILFEPWLQGSPPRLH
jgi:hypothetical protein